MRTPVLLTAALAALALAPATSEAAVTIGSALGASGADNLPSYCPSGATCTGTNLSLPAGSTAGGGLTSPINGVVVRWRLRSGSSGNPVALRVLRPAGGASYTGAGTSPPETTTGAIAQYSSRVRIQAGDGIGLNITNSALLWANTPAANGLAWGSANGFSGGLADGATGAGAAQGGKELLVQADVEPDSDGDGYGDETQDGCPGDPTRQLPPCRTGQVNPNANPNSRPVISSLRIVPRVFRIGGTSTISFRLSENARWTLTFRRIRSGRVRRGRCVLQTRTVRTGARCRHLTLRGRVSGTGVLGTNEIVFRGGLRDAILSAGLYSLRVDARDSRGASALPRITTFTLRPRLARGG